MATVSYDPTFHHEPWVDNVDRVQASGDNGFNIRFETIEAEFQGVAQVIEEINHILNEMSIEVGDDALHVAGNLTVDGNVGIGTTSPAAELHVIGMGGAPSRPLIIESGNDNTNAIMELKNDQGSSAQIIVSRSGLGSDRSGELIIRQLGDDKPIKFEMGIGGEIIRISSDGNVGIKTDKPEAILQVGKATCDGNRWNDVSSLEYKNNVSPLTLEEALGTLNDLNAVTFKYKDIEDDKQHVGFIAEDVPELVASKDRKGLNSMDMVGILTKVVQHQQEEIVALKARINNLSLANTG